MFTVSARISWSPWMSNSSMEKTHLLFCPKGKAKRVWLLEFYRISLSPLAKKLSSASVEPISILYLARGISVDLLALSYDFRKSSKMSNRTTICFMDMDIFLWEYMFAAFLYHKIRTIWWQACFFGTSTDSNKPVMRLGNVTEFVRKTTIYICFGQNIFRNFFVDWKRFVQTLNSLFDRYWLFVIQIRLENEFIWGPEVKALRISSFNNINAFNQSDLSVSPQLIRYEAVL